MAKGEAEAIKVLGAVKPSVKGTETRLTSTTDTATMAKATTYLGQAVLQAMKK